MAHVEYRGLPEVGLPLVTPEDPEFAALARDIQSRLEPIGWGPTGSLNTAAVLLNQSGKAIVVLAHVWRSAMSDGKTRTTRHSNFGSSAQTDFLSGRAPERGTFILPRSKRLITEQGMFGNNTDVLPPQAAHRGGYTGYGGAGGGAGRSTREESTATELWLDLAIFEDGLCAGPDEFGLFETLTRELERQSSAAREIAAALRNGASAGQLFEIIRPLARRQPPPPPEAGAGGRHAAWSPLLPMFANEAIQHLVNDGDAELAAWFERAAQATPVRLRRA